MTRELSRVEIEYDYVRFDGRLVARINPSIHLGTLREFEHFLLGPSKQQWEVLKTEIREELTDEFEAKYSTEGDDDSETCREALTKIAKAGLLTVDEVMSVISEYDIRVK